MSSNPFGLTPSQLARLDQDHAADDETLQEWIDAHRAAIADIGLHSATRFLLDKLATGSREDLEALVIVALARLARGRR